MNVVRYVGECPVCEHFIGLTQTSEEEAAEFCSTIGEKKDLLCGTCIKWANGVVTCIGPGCPNNHRLRINNMTKKHKLKPYTVGDEVPEGAIYLSTTHEDYGINHHYFLIPVKEEETTNTDYQEGVQAGLDKAFPDN